MPETIAENQETQTDQQTNQPEAIINEDLSFADNWRESLPEDIRTDPTIGNIKDLPTAMKMLVNAQKMVGSEKIAVPGPDAGDEQWQDVFKRLGKPDTVDEYNITRPQDWPEDMPYDEQMQKQFLEQAHKLNLLPAQAKGLLDWYNQNGLAAIQQQTQKQKEAMSEAQNTLRQKWGEKYQEKYDKAERFVETFASEEAAKSLVKRFRNEPAVIEMFAEAAESISEDVFRGAQPATFTPTEAQTEINRILGNRKSPYWDKSHPEHKSFVEKVNRYYQAKHPD